MPDPEVVSRADLPSLVGRALGLIASGQRRLIGIAGAPGAGKSTLAEELVAALGSQAVLVPMDGFHLADDVLHRMGIHDRKGAIDTFDAGGFVSLLRRLRAVDEEVVYAPVFRRELEDAVAGSIVVPSGVPLVVTEGNYLLVEDGAWAAVRGLVDEIWYVEVDEPVRLERLVARHMSYGRDRTAAEERAFGSDQRNADLIATTRARADLVITAP